MSNALLRRIASRARIADGAETLYLERGMALAGVGASSRGVARPPRYLRRDTRKIEFWGRDEKVFVTTTAVADVHDSWFRACIPKQSFTTDLNIPMQSRLPRRL